MRIDQAKRLKELKLENSQLKKLVGDISLYNTILKEARSLRLDMGNQCEEIDQESEGGGVCSTNGEFC